VSRTWIIVIHLFNSMEPPKSICRELEEYLKKRRENPQLPFADPKGSLHESRKCGCRYCYAACHSVQGVSNVEDSRLENQDAFIENSRLSLSQPERAKDSGDAILVADFRASGLNFAGGGSSREVFVEDRKL
jgi:hypothetical protein